jgi:hypothetical protein
MRDVGVSKSVTTFVDLLGDFQHVEVAGPDGSADRELRAEVARTPKPMSGRAVAIIEFVRDFVRRVEGVTF